MSHRSVLVVTQRSRQQAIKHALAPFNCQDRSYMKFHETEAERREEYENQDVRVYRSPQGKLFLPHDERFRVPGTIGYCGYWSHKKPEDYEEISVPFAQLYPTFERFMEKYCEEKRDPELNKYGRWKNPNAKWDRWEVGGRWENLLVCNDGNPTSHCQVKELNIDRTRAHLVSVLENTWSEAQNDLADMINSGKKSVEEAKSLIEFLYGIGKDLTVSDYVARNSRFWCSAVLSGGVWHEDPSLNLDDNLSDEWYGRFNELLAGLNPNYYITVVDCHK